MNADRYPLEEVFYIKKRKLDEAEKVLKEKKEILAKEEQKMIPIRKEYEEAKEIRDAKLRQLRETLDQGSTSTKIAQMKQYLKIVDEKLKQKEVKLKEQQKLIDTAKKNVETARLDYIDKQKDVEKIHLHKGEWTKETEKERLHQEAQVEEEIGTAGFAKKRRQKKSSS